MSATQSGHFFDRVPTADTDQPSIRTVRVFRDPVSGRYVMSDSVIVGWAQAFFKDEGDTRTHLDSDQTGARTAALYGSSTVQL